MAKFNTLKIKEIRRETADTVSLTFDIPHALQIAYQYKQGQYITLKLMINGEEIRRSYSICSCPYTEKELRVAVKEVPGGKASTYINQFLKAGDTVEVMTPMGSFNSVLSGNNQKRYVLIAGGSGITPMMSILKSILHIEKKSNVTLIYANRSESSVIFKSELEKIAGEHPDNFRLINVYDSTSLPIPDIQVGILTDQHTVDLLTYLCCGNADEYFVCGPVPLMENIQKALERLRIKRDKVHIEYFSSVINTAAKEEPNGINIHSKVTVIQYGIETNFDLNTEGSTILDAAIEAGVDAPFSCKGAVCCTCRAKVIEGKVKMDANFALTPAEVADGFILTCQSHPLTDKVIVDYDAI